ncbi:tetratricopeptide repeat protein [Metabacillus sediminilitoris]|uniref:Tetratricopeptide repeat protein n=1 Tax=Metabacillus sediminilitoris TaxID=2567941 RepID=A0A4S4C3D1_9BACI|nr:tetratricopeptide repeat protein [Metabacillus sediminilitoris]QGQ48049.1 tetratricopeptide repeat protein [Metabacillus sediminilitoris]THF81589.1 tetratricopeptide repeat protein [Metabacillus sediminilitoris]
MGKQFFNQQKKSQVVPFLQDGQYYYNKGLKAYREQNYPKASKYLQKAVELDPKDSVKLSQLATVYTDMGKYSQSNELLSYILEEVDKEMTECHYFMANNYAHLGLFQEAYKCAVAYTEKDPYGEFIEENEDLIELLTMEDDEDDPFLKDPDDLIIKQDAAKSLLEDSQFEEAISLLEEIVVEYPEFWSAHNNLSLAYFYIGEVEKAKEFLQTVLEKNPGNLHAYCNLLVFYYYERQDEKVEELAKILSNVYPLLYEHRYKLGATFALVGYYPLAYKWLRSLQKQGFEGDDTFYYWLSYSAYFTGRENVAKQMWERVLKENKNKAGSEPWNTENNFSGLLAASMTVEERLYAIFLAKKTNSVDHIKEYQASNVPQSQIEKEFIKFALSKDSGSYDNISSLYYIAETLFDHNDHDELFLFAFRVLINAHKHEYSLTNHCGWAAALQYVWKKQCNESVSQTNIASTYELSVSSVSKYVKLVKNILE